MVNYSKCRIPEQQQEAGFLLLCNRRESISSSGTPAKIHPYEDPWVCHLPSFSSLSPPRTFLALPFISTLLYNFSPARLLSLPNLFVIKVLYFHVQELLNTSVLQQFSFQKIVFIHISKIEYLRAVRRIWKQSCYTEADVKMAFAKMEFYLCRIQGAPGQRSG